MLCVFYCYWEGKKQCGGEGEGRPKPLKQNRELKTELTCIQSTDF